MPTSQTTNAMHIGLGLKPGLCSDRPVTACWGYGAKVNAVLDHLNDRPTFHFSTEVYPHCVYVCVCARAHVLTCMNAGENELILRMYMYFSSKLLGTSDHIFGY